MNLNDSCSDAFYETEIEYMEKGLREAFEEIRNDQLGSKNDERTDFLINCLEEFADFAVTCTNKDPATRNIVKEVNIHQHFDKSCRKKGTDCRFGFPRFPTTETIISIPSRILYKDNPVKEKEMIEQSNKIKEKVLDAMNKESIMKRAIDHRNSEINLYIEALQCIDELKKVKEF